MQCLARLGNGKHQEGFYLVENLLEMERQLTDINDEDGEMIGKLSNSSYRRVAFRQVLINQNLLP